MLSKLQEVELEAIKQVKSTLEGEGIPFLLRGGSVMGAVKYSGFIPWDDDMDIMIPREYFQRALNVLQNSQWSDHFIVASFQNGDEIHSYIPRVLVTEKYRRMKELPTNNHLGLTIIDILPLDGVPVSKPLKFLFVNYVRMIRMFGAVWSLDIDDSISNFSSKREKVLRTLQKIGVTRFYTQEDTYRHLDKFYTWVDSHSHVGKGNITGSLFAKELFDTDVFAKGVYMKFEDVFLPVPSDYDKYLKQLYGNDYATFEPEYKKSHLESHRS